MKKSGITTSAEEVLEVAKDLKVSLDENQVKEVIEYYPTAAANDSTGLWCQIIEQCFYDLDFMP